MRILGLDFGSKIIGMAVSDEMGWSAQGIGTIKRKGLHHDLAEIERYIEEYNVERIVIGLPKKMDGSLGKAAEHVLRFVENLKKEFDMPIDTWDERLSTVAAERVLLQADVSRQKRKQVIDKVAAAIILQGYLDYLKNTSKT